MATAGRASWSTGTVLFLAGITIVGLALRLASFDDSLFGDEIATNFVTNGFGVDDTISLVAGDQEATPPLYFLLASLTNGIGGPEGLRVISLLAGLAAIPLTYLLGVWTVGRRAAMVGAALMALSPFLIFYTTEARAYSLAILFVLLTALALWRALGSGGLVWWIPVSLCTALAAYTHYTTFFALLALYTWAFIFHPRGRKPLLLAGLGAVVLFAPWMAEFFEDSNEPGAMLLELLRPLSFTSAAVDTTRWSIGHPYMATEEVPGKPALWLIGAGIVLAAAALLLRARDEGLGQWWPPPKGVSLVVILAFANPAVVLIVSVIDYTIFTPRNLAASWPGLALTAGALVTAGRAPLRLVAAGLLLAGFAIGAIKMLDEDRQRPDYEAVIDYIERNGPPDTPVVELELPSPGAQSPLEAAIAPQGEPAPRGRKVLPLGHASLATRLRAGAPGPPKIVDPLPIRSGVEIARAAEREAGNGRMFLVLPGANPLQDVRATLSLGNPAAVFLKALSPRYEEVESRSFPGFGAPALSVYVLDGGRTAPAD